MKKHLTAFLSLSFIALLITACQKPEAVISQSDADSLEEKIDTLSKRLAELESNRNNLRAFNRELSEFNRNLTKRAVESYEQQKFLSDNPGVAHCILNIRNIHQAVRANQDLNAYKYGTPIDWSQIFGPENYIKKRPSCPLGGDYILSKNYPEVGTAVAKCPHGEARKHQIEDTAGW